MLRRIRLSTLAAVALTAASAAYAQTATISGVINNFEIINTTGSRAHGFEIQLDGAVPADLYYTVPNARYGAPTIVPSPTGVIVHYSASYVNGTWAATTQTANTPAFSWNDCYLGGANYTNSGCEIFGQWLRNT